MYKFLRLETALTILCIAFYGYSANAGGNFVAELYGVSNSPEAAFTYAGSPYCNWNSSSNPAFMVANPIPSISTGAVAGTFTALPAGLVFVSSSTGEVNLKLSTPGTYMVTNTLNGGANYSSSLTLRAPLTLTIEERSYSIDTPPHNILTTALSKPRPIWILKIITSIRSLGPTISVTEKAARLQMWQQGGRHSACGTSPTLLFQIPKRARCAPLIHCV